MFEITYKIEKPTTPAMSREDYFKIIQVEWSDLLAGDKQRDEKTFQGFFEKHPCMLPRVYDVFGGGHNGIWPSALISQPILPSLNCKIPDFMWIAFDSDTVYAILIEIEAPAKRWTTRNGRPSHLLTQAISQIKDWKAWFTRPLNVAQFKEFYKIPNDILDDRVFLQKYILIYGRRDEATSHKDFSRKKAFIKSENEVFMSYDRLAPNWYLSDCLCTKVTDQGYYAISIPPTLQLGPWHAQNWAILNLKPA